MIIIIGDVNVQNSVWDKHCKNSCKLVLENTILRHALYVDTNTDHTYHQSSSWEELFTSCGLNQDASDSQCNALNH